MNVLFDTHTHDYFDRFDEDRLEMMNDDFANGVVGKVQIGCDVKTSQSALELANQYQNVWCTVGIHPCEGEGNFEEREAVFECFEEMYQEKGEKIVGVGETGFDFFHNDSPEMREKQSIVFEKHLSFAQEKKLPVVVHTRNARNETLEFMRSKKHLLGTGVFHCFSEDADFAAIATQEFGYFLGIGGTATYKKNEAIREAIAKTDIQFLVTETDAPFLAPQGNRGKRNQSKYMMEVVELIAEIKNIPLQECSEILVGNAKRLFFL